MCEASLTFSLYIVLLLLQVFDYSFFDSPDYSLVQWIWFSVVTGCTWVTCMQRRQRTNFIAPGSTRQTGVHALRVSGHDTKEWTTQWMEAMIATISNQSILQTVRFDLAFVGLISAVQTLTQTHGKSKLFIKASSNWAALPPLMSIHGGRVTGHESLSCRQGQSGCQGDPRRRWQPHVISEEEGWEVNMLS